jgi:hypothetical protein
VPEQSRYTRTRFILSSAVLVLAFLGTPVAAQEGRVTFADGSSTLGLIAFETGYHTGTNGMRYQREPSNNIVFRAQGSDATVEVAIARLRSIEISYQEQDGGGSGVFIVRRPMQLTLRDGRLIRGILPSFEDIGRNRNFTTAVVVETSDLVLKGYPIEDFISSYSPRQRPSQRVVRIDFN